MTPIIKDHWAKCPACWKDNSNNILWGPLPEHKQFRCCEIKWTIQMIEAINKGREIAKKRGIFEVDKS